MNPPKKSAAPDFSGGAIFFALLRTVPALPTGNSARRRASSPRHPVRLQRRSILPAAIIGFQIAVNSCKSSLRAFSGRRRFYQSPAGFRWRRNLFFNDQIFPIRRSRNDFNFWRGLKARENAGRIVATDYHYLGRSLFRLITIEDTRVPNPTLKRGNKKKRDDDARDHVRRSRSASLNSLR